jgi:hypothetical protein
VGCLRARVPLRRLGRAEPMAQQTARACCHVYLSSCVANTVDPPVRHLLPPQAGDGFLSVVAFNRIRFPNPSLPFLESPSDSKTESLHPSAPSHLDAKHRNHPEGAPLGSPTWPSAISSTASTSGQLRPRILRWWDRLDLYFIPVYLFREVML